MPARYEDVRPPRFLQENDGADERFVIPAERKPFAMIFLAVWLCAWTFGGLTAIRSLFTADVQPFLLVWLCGWIAGECLAGVSLCWMLTGRETLTLLGSDLEVSHTMLGYSRRRLYRGSEIRDLSAGDKPAISRHSQLDLPFLGNGNYGAVKFSYGARTIHLAANLDEAEGRIIVDALQRRR